MLLICNNSTGLFMIFIKQHLAHKAVLAAILFINVILISCSDTEFTVGKNFVEPQTNVLLIDTFTVQTSTVLIDSIETSGDSILLVGYFEDELVGKVKSNSFFQIGIPEVFNIETGDIFDSITLCLQYSGYSFGDTTIVYKFSVHNLLRQPETFDDGYLYNTSEIEYSEEPVANVSVVPHPKSGDSLEIIFPYEFGKTLFDSILSNSEMVTSETLFLEYFNGFAFINDSSVSASIIGFKANPTALNLRIYYHRIGQFKQALTCDFPITNIENQFNQITHDFTGTKLEGLANQKTSLSSISTDDLAFLYGGIGLLPKIQFPHLQEIQYFDRGTILKAELVIEPESSSYTKFDLPNNLLLYKADKYNRFSGALTNTDGEILYASFVRDNIFHEQTRYTFDISNYIISSLSDGVYDNESGLFICTPASTFANSIARLIMKCRKPGPVLKIYYATY